MKTTLAKESDIHHDWILVDASEKVLGRLAVKTADVLRGRNKVIYDPHMDTGDFVVVVNARKVRLTGKKNEKKIYQSFTGYRSGLKEVKASVVRERKPERMIKEAVRGMLPKNRLMRDVFKRLKVYPDAWHPHEAQKPQPASF